MNPAKRRRLDANASTLRKPFRSPLKVPIDDHTSASRQPKTPNNLDQQEPPHPPVSITSSNDSDSRLKKLHHHISSATPVSPIKIAPNDEATVLQKRYSALTQDLRRLKQDLDVTEQARRLCSSNERKQVEHLVLKWRDIARSAADQVFHISNNRVKEMGGIQAWQKSTQESSRDWLDQSRVMQNKYQYEEDRVSINGELIEDKDVANTKEDDVDDAQQEHSFTMTTMLHQMNIDPDLLSYDDRDDQWTN